MIKLIAKTAVWRLISLLLVDLLLFGMTDASKAPSFLAIVGFVLLMMTFYYICYNFISLCDLYGLKIKHRHQLSIYMTMVAGVLVALQSTGELGTRDVWVLLPLVGLAYFYSSYARSNSL